MKISLTFWNNWLDAFVYLGKKLTGITYNNFINGQKGIMSNLTMYVYSNLFIGTIFKHKHVFLCEKSTWKLVISRYK